MSIERDHKIAIAERFFGTMTAVPEYGGPSRTLQQILAHIETGEEIDPDEDVRQRAARWVDGSDMADEEWLNIERTLNAGDVNELLAAGNLDENGNDAS